MATITSETWANGVLQSSAQAPIADSVVNANAITGRANAALAAAENAITNWATLTAPQKDAAAKLTLQIGAALIRLYLGHLDSPGV